MLVKHGRLHVMHMNSSFQVNENTVINITFYIFLPIIIPKSNTLDHIHVQRRISFTIEKDLPTIYYIFHVCFLSFQFTRVYYSTICGLNFQKGYLYFRLISYQHVKLKSNNKIY